jgi:hypothetical protein
MTIKHPDHLLLLRLHFGQKSSSESSESAVRPFVICKRIRLHNKRTPRQRMTRFKCLSSADRARRQFSLPSPTPDSAEAAAVRASGKYRVGITFISSHSYIINKTQHGCAHRVSHVRASEHQPSNCKVRIILTSSFKQLLTMYSMIASNESASSELQATTDISSTMPPPQTTSLATTKYVRSRTSSIVQSLTMYSMSSTGGIATAELNTTTETTPQESYGAAHAVLFTNELLCDIVARLPLQDIVAATGICKFWRGALKSNPQVQESLFLKPVEIHEVMPDYFICESVNPIPIDRCHVIGKLHPLFRRICGAAQCGEDLDAYINPGPVPNFEHPDGTWRGMLISQPPCKKVIVTITHKDRDIKEIKDIDLHLRNNTGLKIGELYDLIHSHLTNDLYD